MIPLTASQTRQSRGGRHPAVVWKLVDERVALADERGAGPGEPAAGRDARVRAWRADRPPGRNPGPRRAARSTPRSPGQLRPARPPRPMGAGGHWNLHSRGVTGCPVTAVTVTRRDGRGITSARDNRLIAWVPSKVGGRPDHGILRRETYQTNPPGLVTPQGWLARPIPRRLTPSPRCALCTMTIVLPAGVLRPARVVPCNG